MNTMEKIEKALLELTQAHIKTEQAQMRTEQAQMKTEQAQMKTEKSIQALKEYSIEQNKKFNKANKKWESFMGNSGEITEEYFYRSLEKDKRLGKLKFDEIERNVRKSDHNVEFDIILINGDSIGIVEVKNKAHPKDIKPLIEKKIKHFKLDYPEYENYKYYFGIASMITNKTMIQEAKDEGIFLLTQTRDHIEVVNEGFKVF